MNYRPHGSYTLEGPPNDALNFYSRLLFDRDMPPLPRRPDDFLHVGPDTTAKEYRYGPEKGRVEGVVLPRRARRARDGLRDGERGGVRFTVRALADVARPIFALRILRRMAGQEDVPLELAVGAPTTFPLRPGTVDLLLLHELPG